MDTSETMKRIRVRESIESHCGNFIEEKIDRYLEFEHQGIVGGHYFAPASSECIYLYRDGYFIGAVMMSHAINEGIVKFIAERNKIERNNTDGNSSCECLIKELRKKSILSDASAEASMQIWQSYRNDIHHMNPKISTIDFGKIAKQNLKCLSTIEKEIFGFNINNGTIAPTQPLYWDMKDDVTAAVFLRLK